MRSQCNCDEYVKNGIIDYSCGVCFPYELSWFLDERAIFSLLDAQSLLQPGETPEFNWYKDGVPYDPEERFKVQFKVIRIIELLIVVCTLQNIICVLFLLSQDEEDTLALIFQHVKPEDAGLYTCVAATSSGKISCSAELTVQGMFFFRDYKFHEKCHSNLFLLSI